ncbi:MAG: hypothetical protein KAT00_04900 [Planctomycetes bacterium]|nr:hypothetical protein [Planctomycetota bacterium]
MANRRRTDDDHNLLLPNPNAHELLTVPTGKNAAPGITIKKALDAVTPVMLLPAGHPYGLLSAGLNITEAAVYYIYLGSITESPLVLRQGGSLPIEGRAVFARLMPNLGLAEDPHATFLATHPGGEVPRLDQPRQPGDIVHVWSADIGAGDLLADASVDLLTQNDTPHLLGMPLRFEIAVWLGGPDMSGGVVTDYPVEIILTPNTPHPYLPYGVWVAHSTALDASICRICGNIPFNAVHDILGGAVTTTWRLVAHRPVGTVSTAGFAVWGTLFYGHRTENYMYPTRRANSSALTHTNYRDACAFMHNVNANTPNGPYGEVENYATAGTLHLDIWGYVPTTEGGPRLTFVGREAVAPATRQIIDIPCFAEHGIIAARYNDTPTAPGYMFTYTG